MTQSDKLSTKKRTSTPMIEVEAPSFGLLERIGGSIVSNQYSRQGVAGQHVEAK